MRVFVGFAAALALAGCITHGAPEVSVPMGPLEPAQEPIPPEVTTALPPGTPLSDILVRLPPAPSGPCYFWRTADGSVQPVETEAMRASGLVGVPYCVM